MLLGTQFPIKSTSMFKNIFFKRGCHKMHMVVMVLIWNYMFQKILQRWTHLRNSLSPYNRTYVYLKNVANSVWGYYQWERQQKWRIIHMFGGVLLVCVSLWYVFEIYGEVQAFWLVQACLPITCMGWDICVSFALYLHGVKQMDLHHHFVPYMTSSSGCLEEAETEK